MPSLSMLGKLAAALNINVVDLLSEFHNRDQSDWHLSKADRKIINYPDDNSKKWKQNALLISSGKDLHDETRFGFNDANLFLEDAHLVPNGISSTKVFRYPHKPRHQPFQGEVLLS